MRWRRVGTSLRVAGRIFNICDFCKPQASRIHDYPCSSAERKFNSGLIIPTMSLVDQIQKDITAAMKARDEARLSTLRMVKSALMNRKIEKMADLDDKESQQVMATLINQRKDSIEQFTRGGRQEMADREAAEIT